MTSITRGRAWWAVGALLSLSSIALIVVLFLHLPLSPAQPSTFNLQPSTVLPHAHTPTPRSAFRLPPSDLLLVANSGSDQVSFVDLTSGRIEQVTAGGAPWGIALANGRAYVSTAEGIAIVDLATQTRIALVPFQASVGPVRYGEYRPGGMGITSAPDGSRVYVGVYLGGGPSRLETLDIASGAIVSSATIGIRPFDLLVSRDGGTLYALDHDSYSVSAVTVATGEVRTIPAAPLGRGAYDKPHYGALLADGRLALPYQGRTLLLLDPVGDQRMQIPLTADTHQHGVALGTDGRTLFVVGTGPAGGASSGPSLTIVDLETGQETVLPLERPHEHVALSADGRLVYLTGGYPLTGGWDGITILDLTSRTTITVAVPDLPLGLAIVPR